jgi:hypothetical protein
MTNNIYKCNQNALNIANTLIKNGFTNIEDSITESEDRQELKLIIIKDKKIIWLVGDSVYNNIDFINTEIQTITLENINELIN